MKPTERGKYRHPYLKRAIGQYLHISNRFSPIDKLEPSEPEMKIPPQALLLCGDNTSDRGWRGVTPLSRGVETGKKR